MAVMSASDLESVAKNAIDDMEYNLAIHLLETLRDDYADEYEYDENMGTFETPVPIRENSNEHI